MWRESTNRPNFAPNIFVVISIGKISEWCSCTAVLAHPDYGIEHLSIDSRHIEYPVSTLFFAISSKSRDGHNFIGNAYAAGVRNFVVSKLPEIVEFPGSNFLLAGDTVLALQDIATGHRQQFTLPIVGITGSNGKTIVKEWLFQMLGRDYNITRSPGSYNSQIGVPLSIWQLNESSEIGIFEAGISQPGEMARLQKVIQPTIGVFTNIGDAHNEGFEGLESKIEEKLQLFSGCGALILNRDNQVLMETTARYFAGKLKPQLFTWSFNANADVVLRVAAYSDGGTIFTASYGTTQFDFRIPFSDAASIENAATCLCVLLYLDIAIPKIVAAMAGLLPVSMRLEMVSGINDSTIINDAYNFDIQSLKIALDYLDTISGDHAATLILSDVPNPGMVPRDTYNDIANLLQRHKVARLIAIGPELTQFRETFSSTLRISAMFFDSTAAFLEAFQEDMFHRDVVLLKGARKFAFERIAALLQQKVHQTVMRISLSALKHNLAVYRSTLESGVKIMAMVKAFAYGAGSLEIALMLQNAGVDYLTVAYTDEGVALRKAGIRMPIMVMSPDISSFERMVSWKLEPEIYNFRSLHAFAKTANLLGVDAYPIHIKLDTGMHRLGFEPGDLAQLVAYLNPLSVIKVASIFSHLAAGDDRGHEAFTRLQAERFHTMSTFLGNGLSYSPSRHLCNSAGIAGYPALHFDMVRLGLGLYGIDGTGTLSAKLQNVSTLTTVIAQIRTVARGETVGYGNNNPLERDTVIATVCIGYADGYLRRFGNGRAFMLVHGKPAYTVGSICMDMCMLDLGEIPEAREGDEVTVFGVRPTIADLAAVAETIPYEVMTGISQRVKRIYTEE